MRFEGKRVLISGAGSGFGRQAALRFAEEGARLSLSDISETGLAETVAKVGAAHHAVVDVSDERAHSDWIAAAAEALGGIDIALNNAGIVHSLMPLHETPVAEFDRMMAVNARGVFIGMKHQIPVMRAQGSGVILNTASVAGLIGAGLFGAYVASKHAVVGLTRTAADEYARDGIRVNAICPAFTASPMLDGIAGELRRGDEAQEATLQRMARGIPAGRVGTTEEIVEAMLLLCDPANTYMTGQCIGIDGGLTAI